MEGDDDTDTTSPERHIGSLRFESWDMGHKPFVHGQGDPVPSSPQNESPCGAVPESSEQHGDNQVDVGSYVAFAVSSKRNVEVVFQPAGEGDVPAAPEFGDGRRFIGGVEVFVEMEAEQQSDTDGHIGVAGEVAIDLQGVAIESHQVFETAI